MFRLIPGGFRIPPLCHSRGDAGSDLQRDQEALLRSLLQSGRELHGRGLDHHKGGLKAEGNDESVHALTTHGYLILMS